MVAGPLWISVVARMNIRCSGGSSKICNRALNAWADSICTSSMIYTRFFTAAGVYTASSRMARMSSTRLLEAASSSSTSRMEPFSIPRQAGQALQGLPSTGCSQFTARASSLAQEVLPVPRVPVNR